MIPSIEEILRMLKAGECDEDQALQWIGSHIELVANREVLRDTFASMADVGRDADGNLIASSVAAVMGEAPPEPGDLKTVGNEMALRHEHEKCAAAMRWWCTAEARIRYAKADAMLEARLL